GRGRGAHRQVPGGPRQAAAEGRRRREGLGAGRDGAARPDPRQVPRRRRPLLPRQRRLPPHRRRPARPPRPRLWRRPGPQTAPLPPARRPPAPNTEGSTPMPNEAPAAAPRRTWPRALGALVLVVVSAVAGTGLARMFREPAKAPAPDQGRPPARAA